QAGFNQSEVGNALANAQVLTPDLNHGRLNVYQAVSAWVNSSSSTTTSSSSSSSCSLLCLEIAHAEGSNSGADEKLPASCGAGDPPNQAAGRASLGAAQLRDLRIQSTP